MGYYSSPSRYQVGTGAACNQEQTNRSLPVEEFLINDFNLYRLTVPPQDANFFPFSSLDLFKEGIRRFFSRCPNTQHRPSFSMGTQKGIRANDSTRENASLSCLLPGRTTRFVSIVSQEFGVDMLMASLDGRPLMPMIPIPNPLFRCILELTPTTLTRGNQTLHSE